MTYFLIVTTEGTVLMMILISNCDTKEKVGDETNSNCGTCLVEDESVTMGGENSIPLDVTNHDYTCQPLGLGN